MEGVWGSKVWLTLWVLLTSDPAVCVETSPEMVGRGPGRARLGLHGHRRLLGGAS